MRKTVYAGGAQSMLAALTFAAPVQAGGTAVINGLENQGQKVLTLKAGTVSASFAAAGTTEALIGPADVPVTRGKNTIVYPWGSLDAGTLGVAVQVVDSATWRGRDRHDFLAGGVPAKDIQYEVFGPDLWLADFQ